MNERELWSARAGRSGRATVSLAVLWAPSDVWVGLRVDRFRRLGGAGAFSGCLRLGIVPALSVRVGFFLWPKVLP